jgi:hypothetical protein
MVDTHTGRQGRYIGESEPKGKRVVSSTAIKGKIKGLSLVITF